MVARVLEEALDEEAEAEEDLVWTFAELVPAGLLLVPATLVVAEEPAGRRRTVEEPELLLAVALVPAADEPDTLVTPPLVLTAERGANPMCVLLGWSMWMPGPA